MVLTKIRKLRKEKGISQTFISQKLGYAYPSGYSNIESGRTKMSYNQAVIIAEVLGVTTDDLAEESLDHFSGKELHKMCKSKTA